MATVRIFKIAELLGTTSQEVTALLKRDHGIEVKSASSTIEEVVARQFVDRLAKQRNVTLPAAHMFAGRFEAASLWAEQAFTNLPSFLMVVGVIALAWVAWAACRASPQNRTCHAGAGCSAMPVIIPFLHSSGAL